MSTRKVQSRRELIDKSTSARTRTKPKGERVVDVGHQRPPTMAEIINRHVKQAVEAHLISDKNEVETFEDFQNWDTPDNQFEPPWVSSHEMTPLMDDYEPFHAPLEPLTIEGGQEIESTMPPPLVKKEAEQADQSAAG